MFERLRDPPVRRFRTSSRSRLLTLPTGDELLGDRRLPLGVTVWLDDRHCRCAACDDLARHSVQYDAFAVVDRDGRYAAGKVQSALAASDNLDS